LDLINVLLDFGARLSESCAQVIVVSVWNLFQELNSTSLHAHDSLDNIFSAHGNVLHACATVVLHELLDLTLTHAVSWLVDGHLDLLIEVGHDHRAEGREVGMDHLVID